MSKKKGGDVQRQILFRLEQRRWLRRLDQKAEKRRRNRMVSAGSTPRRLRVFKGRTSTKAPLHEVVVPPVLDLLKEHSATCKFVDEVRSAARTGSRVMLRFDEVKRIKTEALVYFLSQIHKLRLEHGDRCITGTYPKAASVERLLSESGFFKLLNVRTRERVRRPSARKRYIQFKSDLHLAVERVRELREEILRTDFVMPNTIRSKVFRAVSEAMLNVGHHAYQTKSFVSSQANRQLNGRWWLLANLDVRENIFTLVFADSGVGIPKTLPRTQPMELVRRMFSILPHLAVDDGQMIEAAMVLGRTRTKRSNRGKGLMDLTQLIDIVGGGKMHIFSRKGMLTYTAGTMKHRNLDQSLEGTLIEWVLPLDKALVALEQFPTDETDLDD
jgi:hypothetical protein